MTFTAIISKALFCIGTTCYPMLYGNATPIGTFPLIHVATDLPGYGGDVIAYKFYGDYMFSIHRIYLRNPVQHRLQRLQSITTSDNKITDGCINLDDQVYSKVVDALSNTEKNVLIIEE